MGGGGMYVCCKGFDIPRDFWEYSLKANGFFFIIFDDCEKIVYVSILINFIDQESAFFFLLI